MRLLALLSFLLFAAAPAFAQDKVIYHFDSGLSQATKGLRNIRNHLDTDPKAKIVAVAHAEGVDFLMEGKRDPNGNSYEALVQDLLGRGVDFRICEITLRNRKLTRAQFVIGPNFVPSGVVEITRLQQKEGHAYLKP